jgi:hypothetical protein
MTITRVSIGQPEKDRILRLLRQHCLIIEYKPHQEHLAKEDRLGLVCEYEPGWTDAKIAQVLGGRINERHVFGQRTIFMGTLKGRAGGTGSTTGRERIKNLETTVQHIQNQLDEVVAGIVAFVELFRKVRPSDPLPPRLQSLINTTSLNGLAAGSQGRLGKEF